MLTLVNKCQTISNSYFCSIFFEVISHGSLNNYYSKVKEWKDFIVVVKDESFAVENANNVDEPL